jgi:putative ABC transport system substrate-binding protein
VRRRDFIVGIAGSAAAWPLSGQAQQLATPVIGFLRSTSLADSAHIVAAFRQGLSEGGFVEGQNVEIEFRWADNRLDRLPALLAELMSRRVAVIVANTPAALVAKTATTTIPIVFASGGDPVREGLVASLNRPGANVTGVSYLFGAVAGKRLDLLSQVLPKGATIGVLANPNIPNTAAELRDLEAAANEMGRQLFVIKVSGASEFDSAFAAFVKRGVGGLYVGTGGFLNSHRDRLVALADRYALPASYVWREAALAGGLMSYGPSIANAHHQVGIYTGRILKGEKPADLPVVQSTKFDFVINLKTAKTLGLEIPPMLLALAEEVIE